MATTAITRKYPRKYLYLPHNFGGKSDNNRIKGGIIHTQSLEIDRNLLGINPVAPKKPKSIEMTFGGLYIINAKGTELYKIGITSNIVRRFNDLAGASPIPIDIVFYAQMDYPEKTESEIHERYKHLHFKNEWFLLSFEDVLKIKSEIDERYEIPNR